MAGEFDPTERLDEVVVDPTDELPLASESLGATEGRRRFGNRKPLDDKGGYENNGSPLVWLAIAAVLLLGAVAVIVAVGQRDNDGAADGDVDGDVTGDTNIGDDLSDEAGPPETPLVGDPSASATDDFNVTTTDGPADTSPPDEAADDEPVTTIPESDAPTSTSSAAIAAGELIIGDAVITVTANDFEIALSTSSCTTIEWSFAGEGQSNAYDSGADCFDQHLLSPRPEDPLLPGTSYEVTASFVADGVRQVAAFTVVTATG
jgi:hypothetical protein